VIEQQMVDEWVNTAAMMSSKVILTPMSVPCSIASRMRICATRAIGSLKLP